MGNMALRPAAFSISFVSAALVSALYAYPPLDRAYVYMLVCVPAAFGLLWYLGGRRTEDLSRGYGLAAVTTGVLFVVCPVAVTLGPVLLAAVALLVGAIVRRDGGLLAGCVLCGIASIAAGEPVILAMVSDSPTLPGALVYGLLAFTLAAIALTDWVRSRHRIQGNGIRPFVKVEGAR